MSKKHFVVFERDLNYKRGDTFDTYPKDHRYKKMETFDSLGEAVDFADRNSPAQIGSVLSDKFVTDKERPYLVVCEIRHSYAGTGSPLTTRYEAIGCGLQELNDVVDGLLRYSRETGRAGNYISVERMLVGVETVIFKSKT